MLKLKQVQRDWFNIIDDCGSMVGATLEDLHTFNSEIVKQTGMFSASRKKEERVHNVLLENNCCCEKVQLRLSDSALRFLDFLLEHGWMDDDDIQYTTLEDSDYEFI